MAPSKSRRNFLKGLGLGSAAVVAATLPGATPVPVAPTAPAVVWTCITPKCAAENRTPADVWPSVKLNLACVKCDRRQPYLWHLKKFDPHPTEYQHTPGHVLTGVLDQPSRLKEK